MLTLYHCKGTRSGGALWLLEELGVRYEIERVPVTAEGGAPESYRAVHPHKKVPAIDHDGVIVTERAAIFTYLCDAFPNPEVGVPVGDTLRGPFLSWLVYNDAVIDPVIGARFAGWTYDPRGVSYGRFEDAVAKVDAALAAGPYLLGERFSAADIQVSGGLNFAARVTKHWPLTEALDAYLKRVMGRPAAQRAFAKA